MSYQEKNITASLVASLLILFYYLTRVFQMSQNELVPGQVFRLWGTVIILSIVVTIVGTILTHVVSAVVQAAQTQGEEPKLEDDFEDERDKLISLKGTRVAYFAFSIGTLLSMLSYVIWQQPLVMFALLILFGQLSQISSDASRLIYYRRGV